MSVLFKSNGKVLNIYNIAEPIMTICSVDHPIKHNGYEIIDDVAARLKVRKLIDSKLYKVVVHKDGD